MGNSLRLPCVCYDANGDKATTTAAGAERSRKQRKTAGRNGRAAAARHVVPVDAPEESDYGEKEVVIKQAAPWPGVGYRVEHVGGDDGGVRVKIVMKKKEVEELVARLEQRDAAERKARMGELSTELGGGAAAVAMMSPCRDAAWRPRLASIPEN